MYAVIQINKSNNSLINIETVSTKEEAIEQVEYYKSAYCYTNQFDFVFNELVF